VVDNELGNGTNGEQWIMLEKAQETNRILSEFFEEYGGLVKASL
jgi:hypothetical protein